MTFQTNTVAARLIFTAALKLADESARAEYLESVCGNDSTLKTQLEQLLAAASLENRDNPLRRVTELVATISPMIPDQDLATTDSLHPDLSVKSVSTFERPPDIACQPQIGPYRIREQIGEGGMGYVYVAEQTEPIRRKVAIKVIRPGMDTKEVIARFESERQALAMMDHPNIARIVDGGTTGEGRPYFVMELVRGVPITEFCTSRNLQLSERLGLFIDICKAVQHAHQKGIIHRDLKPNNIMITLRDGKPVVKVIDFGVAKALTQDLTDRTLYTKYSCMIGTPLYMAPEQAEMSCLDIDTRSDIYSLGVILYELLTGTTPFDRKTISELGFDGIRKIIKEYNPERPSVRISTVRAGQSLTIEDQRTVDSEDISRHLRGELDWVVMKALEKDRERRYESANAFAADIQRYLSDEPVEACPPTLGYRLRKYARKHKGLLTTAALLIAMLVVSTAVSTIFAFQANAARNEAEDARELADKRLEQSRVDLDRALKSLDLVVEQLSSAEFAQIPGVANTRTSMLQQMLTLYEEIASEHDNDPYVKRQQGIAYRRISEILWLTDQYDEAEQAVNRGIVILEELIKADPKNHSHNSALASLLFHRLHLWPRSKVARLADAERGLLLWQELVEEGHGEHAAILGLMHLKVAKLVPNDSLRVDRHLRESIRIPESYGLTPHWSSYLELARRDKRNRDWDSAEANYRRCIEISRHSVTSGNRVDRGLHAANCSEFAQLLNRQGRPEDARKLHREAIDVARQLYEEYGRIPAYESSLKARVRAFLTDAANERQKEDVRKLLDGFVARWPEVTSFHELRAPQLAELDDAFAVLSSAIDRYPDQTAYYRSRAEYLRDRGEHEAARADLEKALGLTNEDSVAMLKIRAEILNDLSRSKEAVITLEEAIGRALEQRESTARLHDIHARILYESRRDRVRELSDAIVMYPEAAPYYHYRGAVHRDEGRFATAIVDFEAAIRYDKLGLSDWYHFDLEGARAEALRKQNDYENALAHYDIALSYARSERVQGRRTRLKFQLGRFDEVLTDIAKAMELAPGTGNPLTWIPVGDVAGCPDQRFKDGIVAIADHAVDDNDTAALRVARGTLLGALKYDDRAQHDFEKALEMAPARDDAYSSYLTFLAWRERWQEARQVAEKWTTIQPAAYFPHYQAAILSLAAGDPQAYRKQCRNTLDALAGSDIPLESHFAAWTCALASGAIDNYEPAIQLARQAVEQEPENSQYLNGLGAILMRAGRYEDARQSLEEALAVDEKDSTSRGYSRYFLAMTAHYLGNTALAQEQLKAANAVAAKELTGNPAWNRRLTLELLRDETEKLLSSGQ